MSIFVYLSCLALICHLLLAHLGGSLGKLLLKAKVSKSVYKSETSSRIASVFSSCVTADTVQDALVLIGDSLRLYGHFEAHVPDPDRSRPDTLHDAVINPLDGDWLVGWSVGWLVVQATRLEAPRSSWWYGNFQRGPGP